MSKRTDSEAICRALDILIWKVPAVAGNESGEWWAAELQDKGILIRWDKEEERFRPLAQ